MTSALVEGRLYVECWGDPGAPALLYLHGGPGQGSYEFVAHQAARLSTRLRVVALDQRGVLRSAPLPPDGDLRLADLVEDCEAVRRNLGLDRWTVLGQSFGGMLALRYAVEHPHAVSAVVFENPCWDVGPTSRSIIEELATGPTAARHPDVAERARATLREQTDARALWQALGPLLDALGADRELVYIRDDAARKRIREVLAAAPFTEEQWSRGGTQQQLLNSDPQFYAPHTPDLKRLRRPALLVKGGLDPVPSQQEVAAFRAAFGQDAVALFEGAGHFVQAEAPERYAELVTAFALRHAADR